MHEFCKVEKEGHLLIMTLNRPDRLNSMHPPSGFEYERVLDEFQKDPDLWVMILTGEGRAFSAGNDLKFQAEFNPKGTMPRAKRTISRRFGDTKPIIAAVNGLAMGGGFETALGCDLIVASENAIFALPEPRVGLMAGGGGLIRLPRLIGEKRAMSMILTGRRVTAQEGFELGFVNEVVKGGNAECVAAAKKWAEQIMECGPLSVRASKQVVQETAKLSVEEAFEVQNNLPAATFLNQSEDFVEGPKAFSEKRAPNWKGK